MRILTLDNQFYDLDHLPEEVDDMRFAILDNSNPADPDYHFIPLIFLDSFNAPALVLRIGEYTLRMPMDWQILIGEPDMGDLEVLPLTSINDRGFKVFQFKTVNSTTFIDEIERNLLAPNRLVFDYDEWIYHNGLPKNCVSINSPRLMNMQSLAKRCSSGENIFDPVISYEWKKVKNRIRMVYSIDGHLYYCT